MADHSASSSSWGRAAVEEKGFASQERDILATAAQQLMQLSEEENSSSSNNKEQDDELVISSSDNKSVSRSKKIPDEVTSRIKISIEEIFGREYEDEDGEEVFVNGKLSGKRPRYRAVADLYSATKPLNNDDRYRKKSMMSY